MGYKNKVWKVKKIYFCNDQSSAPLYSHKRMKHLPRIQLIFFQRGVGNSEVFARRKIIVIFVRLKPSLR